MDTIGLCKVADVMVDILRSEGVRYVFGNPGTTEIPLLSSLASVRDIAYVLALQEAAVVAMADGYARVSGNPGFVNLHSAGGLGHAMGALIHSHAANTPLVITAGQPDTRHGVMDPLLGGDLVNIARPAVKWAREVTQPHHLPVLLRRAFNDCQSAPGGPVFLALPLDIMEASTYAGTSQRSRINRANVAGGLDEMGRALTSTEPGRLAIVAGDEVFAAQAGAETVELAEALGAPVFGSSWPSCQVFPATHALWHGHLPTKAAEIRARLEAFKAVLVLGGHSLITYVYTEGPALPPTCRLLQLSADAHNLGRVYSTHLACAGDIKQSLRALLPMIHRQMVPHRNEVISLRERANQAQLMRLAAHNRRVAIEIEADLTTPFVAAHEIMQGIGSQAAIVDESPVTMEFTRLWLSTAPRRPYLFMRGAILGWGMPAAVGVCLGTDREPVISLVGDGSSLYSPQALWTAAHEQLPVTFVVMNNREYGILKKHVRAQKHPASECADRFIGMDLIDPPIDFPALAASMGLPAVRVGRAADIAGAVEASIKSMRPSLIEVPICT